MKVLRPSPTTLTRRAAFSLIEVVLALGVTSFALLSMVALIPMGLTTAREASDATTEAQIVQFARNEIELTSFSNLGAWSGATGYFDNEGLPTTQGAASQIYTVTYAVTNMAMSIDGSTSASSILINTGPTSSATNAMRVEVTIVNRTVAGTAATNVFPIVVPNAGF
ncbi:MAG: Verru_Chthon cassette protein B [Verrucomicrobiota bacterium]